MYAGNAFIVTNQECNLRNGKPCNITAVMGKIQFTVHIKKSNKIQQCIQILFHIYMKLNMFRATHCPSSGA